MASSDLIVAADGSGDYTDVIAAVAALPATGGHVYIRAGTYTLAGKHHLYKAASDLSGWITLNLPSSVVLQGEGPGITVLCGSAQDDTSIIGAFEQHNITLLDFTLEGGGNPGYGVSLNACDDCLVQNVVVDAAGPPALNTGIGAYGARNRYVGCTVTGAKVIGFELGYGDDGTEVAGCRASQCAFGVAFDPYPSLPPQLRSGPNRHLRISNCEFSHNSNSGLQLCTCESAIVSNCVISDNGFFGIAVVPSGPGNWPQDPVPTDILQVLCSGLVVRNNGQKGSGQAGIWLNGNGSVITDTLFWGNQPNAVRMSGQHLVISNSTFIESQYCIWNDGVNGSMVAASVRDASSTGAALGGQTGGLDISGLQI